VEYATPLVYLNGSSGTRKNICFTGGTARQDSRICLERKTPKEERQKPKTRCGETDELS
jgi:hypothetical protein